MAYGASSGIKQVVVKEVDTVGKVATCLDTEAQYLDVSTIVHRTGITVAVGQTWIIDRAYGGWTFAAWLDI